MELIEVLDETGAKTKQIATRSEVHKAGLWHKVAAVAILNNKNQILLQQRSKDKITNPGKWDISAVGHIDAGENAITTAMRETAEEVGIKAKTSDFYYITSYQKITNYSWKGKNLIDRQFCDCFILRIPEICPEDLTLQASEVQNIKLCSCSEFRQMISDGLMLDRQPFYDALIKLLEEK